MNLFNITSAVMGVAVGTFRNNVFYGSFDIVMIVLSPVDDSPDDSQ